jgi:hypothetical protein
LYWQDEEYALYYTSRVQYGFDYEQPLVARSDFDFVTRLPIPAMKRLHKRWGLEVLRWLRASLDASRVRTPIDIVEYDCS